MNVVEVRRRAEGVAYPISQMNQWLRCHNIEASAFQLMFLPNKEIRFHLEFRDFRAATAFAAAFAGELLSQRSAA